MKIPGQQEQRRFTVSSRTPRSVLTRSRASVAPRGNLLGQSLNERSQIVDTWPAVFGRNVWVKRPPVVSCKRLAGGIYERVQVISVGRFGNDDCGEVKSLDTNVYNDLGQVIGTVTAWRQGFTNQERLPQVGIWNPAADGCCVCNPLTGVYSVQVTGTADRAFIVLDLAGDNVPHAWSVTVNGNAVGTLWHGPLIDPTPYAFEMDAPAPANIVFTPIITGGAAPFVEMLPLSTQAGVTVGPFYGRIQAAPLPSGLAASPAGVSSISLGAVALNYPGLCVVQTSTTCAYPPSFKVIEGKTARFITGAGVYDGDDIDLSSPLLAQGQKVQNLTTGAVSTINETSTVKSLDTPLPLSWGDRWVAYGIEVGEYLPDILWHLLRSIAGQNIIASPNWMVDFRALYETKTGLQGLGYTWHGIVGGEGRSMPILRWLALTSAQCSCYPIRSQGKIGLRLEFMEPPVALFTVGNSRSFQIQYHPWHEHVINRLIIWQNREGVNPYSLIIESQTLAEGSESLVEEALDWNEAPREVLENAANLYYRSIQIQDRSISFVLGEVIDLRVGDLVEAWAPDAETGGTFSGYVATATGSVITPNFRPELALGLTGPNSSGNTLIDDTQDFTIYVRNGDHVVFDDETTSYEITAVSATQLTLAGSPNIKVRSRYSVLDLTPPPNSEIAIWDSKANIYESVPFTVAITGGVVRYDITSNVIPSQGMVIALRNKPALWRISSVEPIPEQTRIGDGGQAGADPRKGNEFEVIAVRWDPIMYSFQGQVVRS